MTERNGIEIDYCPQCRGVWLDRGELDKIIERTAAYEQRTSLSVPPQSGERREAPRYEYYDDDGRYHDDDRRHPHGKRKRSFLGDMFDIFD
jgi:Zn-finger nucleic acid-binding protein